MRNITSFAAGALLVALSTTAGAAIVDVQVNGTVDFNGIVSGAFGDVNSGDPVVISFQVDSNVFVNGSFPVRGYAIDPSSFSFTAGSATVGIADPIPDGRTPYFVIRNDDPAVDGFFIGTTIDGFPNGVPIDEPGGFGPFFANFSVTYTGDTLSTLDILDATGSYDYTNLTVFGMTLMDGPFEAMFVNFDSLSISVSPVPVPGAVWLLGSAVLGLGGLRRRR